MTSVEKRKVVLLAPVYSDVRGSLPTSVKLQRTNDDWLKFVFSTPQGPVEHEVQCINSHVGCRCDYVRLLKALMVLSERNVLKLKGSYTLMAPVDNVNPIATLELTVKVRRKAQVGESLKGFQLVLCHLQTEGLGIAKRSAISRTKDLVEASRSSCHVVGCKLHSWTTDNVLGPKSKLRLPDVFESLMTEMEEQSEPRRNGSAQVQRSDGQIRLTNLPANVMHIVVCWMDAKSLASFGRACSLFRRLSYEVVPGLKLVLYEHQQKGLKWMLYRETPSLINGSLTHPFLFPRHFGKNAKVAIDLLDMKVVEQVDTTVRDTCGGMFCDEPGLGKTITMLALILRTKGQVTKHASNRDEHDFNAGLRSATSRYRSVPPEELVNSKASLIVVPDPLVEHWKYQIEAHVVPGALKTFVDESDADLPSNVELASYDVVVTSFKRLAKEWKLHRPASALEMRMPKRYGFEGPQRYSDGTIRGEISSLLTVRWVRVIVDEGHKLGGQTPTNLMQMARIISAERRWVMTGTPTPNTLQSADLRFMHGLLVFLRNKPFGQPDGRAWIKAIARPFEQNHPVAFFRLRSLLSRIMMRHTKESIREILPQPIRHTVYIDPTPSEFAQYNVVAAAVRANLVITNMDPEDPGKLHPDSLLNPMNRKEALQVVSNLRLACCGGVNSEVVLSNAARLETINMLSKQDVDGDDFAKVVEYLHRVTLRGMTTMCGSCQRNLQLLMILPCGHLCCADCVEDRNNKVGTSCFKCHKVFNPEIFQVLQPGFAFREIEDDNDENCVRNGQQDVSRGIGPTQKRPQQSGGPAPNRHYWTVDASKIFYAATRVQELKKEFARRNASQDASHSHRARYVKVIIFSQFTEIIWRTKLAFEQLKILTANFITRVSPKVRMKALKNFRTDPSLNVLLLSEMGSHGLDLSFVTHVFLMEEIWDKSLEQQVISRAHRMGASQAVVVEQLWMRGSVESQMAKVVEGDESEATASNVIQDDTEQPARTRKRINLYGGALLNVAGKKRRRNLRGDAKKLLTGNKSSFLQRKLDYVLNHLRLLDKSVMAEPRQVRFFVVDKSDGTTIRKEVHTVQSSSRNSTARPSLEPLHTRNTLSNTIGSRTPTTSNVRPVQSAVSTRPTVAVPLQSALPLTAAQQHAQKVNSTSTSQLQARRATTITSAPATRAPIAPKIVSRNRATAAVPPQVSSTSRAESQPAASSSISAASPHSVTTIAPPAAYQECTFKPPSSDSKDASVMNNISAEHSHPDARVHFSIAKATESASSPEIIEIDNSSSSNSDGNSSNDSDSDISMASSSNCPADIESNFGSGESDDDSDEESKALFSQLIHVAKRHFARHQSTPRADEGRAQTAQVEPAAKTNTVPEIDDEETETE